MGGREEANIVSDMSHEKSQGSEKAEGRESMLVDIHIPQCSNVHTCIYAFTEVHTQT